MGSTSTYVLDNFISYLFGSKVKFLKEIMGKTIFNLSEGNKYVLNSNIEMAQILRFLTCGI